MRGREGKGLAQGPAVGKAHPWAWVSAPLRPLLSAPGSPSSSRGPRLSACLCVCLSTTSRCLLAPALSFPISLPNSLCISSHLCFLCLFFIFFCVCHSHLFISVTPRLPLFLAHPAPPCAASLSTSAFCSLFNCVFLHVSQSLAVSSFSPQPSGPNNNPSLSLSLSPTRIY